jgi:transposase
MNEIENSTVSISEYKDLEAKYLQTLHELQWLKRQLFGSKSERYIPNDQQTELELDVNKNAVEIEEQHVSYTRTLTKKTSGHSRTEIPTHLPYDDIVIEPKEDIGDCEKIGEEISWEYEYNPGTLFVRRYIRSKYVNKAENKIIIGELPNRPVDKGNFGPGIMSTITTDKYLYHIPLHRQREKFRNEYQIEFAESTFCDIIANTVFWLRPVYDLQKNRLIQSTYIQADETPIPVLTKGKNGKTHKGFYWVYYDPVFKNVIFEYKSGRGREGPNVFLKDFRGVLQVDGYGGYNELASLPYITRAGCMAHVRRKFEAALDSNRKPSEYALSVIGKWFDIEREAAKHMLTYEQRCIMRNDIMKSGFESFKEWMMNEAANHLPKSPTRKALEYALGQWDGFNVLFEDGRVELSNNLVENAIRPVALGRKNYMFKGSEDAAQRGAVIYSVVATAELHGKEPREYIKTLLEILPNEKSSSIDKYLPWKIELQAKS